MGTPDPLAAVHRYIAAFNRGDGAGMAPHVWLGPSAAQNWYRDVLVEGEHHGASGYAISLGEPLNHNVTGDLAYLAIPTTMDFSLQGTPVTQRVAAGWRITGWAWTKGAQQ